MMSSFYYDTDNLRGNSRMSAINLRALHNALCPHCGSGGHKVGFNTCHACNKEFAWVESNKTTDSDGGPIVGTCLKGQEGQAINALDEKVMERNRVGAANMNMKAQSAQNRLIGAIVVVGACSIIIWFATR